MYAPAPDEKFDFQNMDVKLYLALKAVLTPCKTQNAALDIEKQAKRAMYEFEQSFGPIPDWAVARNFGYELVPGAQLCTRDGRRTGNAHIVFATVPPTQADPVYYHCLTDAGSKFVFNAQELEACFTIGDWISDPARIIKDFDRNGEFQEQRL